MNRTVLIISLALILFLQYFLNIKIIFFIVGLSILLLYYFFIYYYKKNIFLINKQLLNISLVIGSFLLGIYGLEILFHLTKPQFLHLSYSITGEFTDFTVREYFPSGVSPKNGVFRILGVGDSFSQIGRGQWNYHDVLQRKFEGLYGSNKVEVINTGIGDTGPGYYWNTLEKHGDLFQPDVVLVGFFIGNDLLELKFDRISVGSYIREPRDLAERMWGYLQFKNLWLYQFSKVKMTLMFDDLRKEIKKRRMSVNNNESFCDDNFLFIERARLGFCEVARRPWVNKLWQNGSDVFLKMKEWCRQRGAKLVILVLPDEFQIEPDLLQEVMKKYNLTADALDIFYPNRILRNFCAQNDINLLDLTMPLQAAGKSQRLYLLNDTHMNETGNQEAGDLIFDYLQKNQLVNLNKSSKNAHIASQPLPH